MTRLRAAAAIALLAGGCGKGLVAGTTYDRPLLTITGTLRPAGALRNARDRANSGPPRRPLLTLLWTDPLQRRPDLPAPAHAVRSTVDAAADTFELQVFRAPPAAALVDVAAPGGGGVATLAVAEIVAIDDADGDGTFRASGARADIAAPDLYLAGSTAVVTYLARPFADPQAGFPLAATNAPGFDLAGYDCEGPVSRGIQRVAAAQVEMVLQPSLTLPEVRTCRRSHAP